MNYISWRIRWKRFFCSWAPPGPCRTGSSSGSSSPPWSVFVICFCLCLSDRFCFRLFLWSVSGSVYVYVICFCFRLCLCDLFPGLFMFVWSVSVCVIFLCWCNYTWLYCSKTQSLQSHWKSRCHWQIYIHSGRGCSFLEWCERNWNLNLPSPTQGPQLQFWYKEIDFRNSCCVTFVTVRS